MKKFFILRNDFKFYNDLSISKNSNLLIFLSKRLTYNINFLNLFRQTVFGVNIKFLINNLCIKFGFNKFINIQFLSKKFLIEFQQLFRESFVNFELIEYINNRISLKISLKIFSGIRKTFKLPSRGQRTKSNAQTSKKKLFLYFNL